MALLDLPLEVLQQIIEETIPEAIEKVAVTCRLLHEASKMYLKEHNRLRKRYRHFKFSRWTTWPGKTYPERIGPCWDTVTQETGIDLLDTVELIVEIARNPIVSRYIKTADFTANWGLSYFPHLLWDRVEPGRKDQCLFPRIKDDEAVEQVRRLLHQNPYLREAGVDPDVWLDGIQKDTVGHAEVLMLTLLPRVRELAPASNWDEIPGRHVGHLRYGETVPTSDRAIVWPVLDAIVRRANDRSLHRASLSKLKVLKPYAGTGYEVKGGLTYSTPFLAIKSLREAYIGGCVGVGGPDAWSAFRPEYPEYSANLRTLELVGACLGPSEMREVLTRLPGLRELRFAQETKWHAPGEPDFDAGQMADVIMECTGEYLRKLELWMIVTDASTGRTLMDMSGFKRLEHLLLDGYFLMGTTYRRDDKKYKLRRAPSVCPLEDMAAPRMVDMLPRSLKRFELQMERLDERRNEVPQLNKCLRALAAGFKAERKEKLPKLKHAFFDVFDVDLEEGVQAELEAEGVVVDARTGDDPSWPDFVDHLYTWYGMEHEYL